MPNGRIIAGVFPAVILGTPILPLAVVQAVPPPPAVVQRKEGEEEKQEEESEGQMGV